MSYFKPDKLNILDIPYKNFVEYLKTLDGWQEECDEHFLDIHEYYTEFRHYYVNEEGARFPSCRLVIFNDQDSDYYCFNWRTTYLGTVACITGKSIQEIIENLYKCEKK